MFIFLQKLLPQHLLSRIVGYVANSEIRIIKHAFMLFAIKRYGINLQEAKDENLGNYKNFNDFFTRELKVGSRPVSGRFCSPADGKISAAGSIEDGQIFQAKGLNYSLNKLLASNDVDHYAHGSFMTVYLSPKDYHRVHCPIDAKLLAAKYVPGKLFSVNQQTADNVRDLFSDNERLVMEFETTKGKMSVVMVGCLLYTSPSPRDS